MTMEPTGRSLPTRFTVFKSIGYALVALGLILWMLLTSTPQLALPQVLTAIWMLIGGGIILVIVNKSVEIIQQYRMSHRRALCLSCGWFGSGREWFRYECCPDCDSREIALQ